MTRRPRICICLAAWLHVAAPLGAQERSFLEVLADLEVSGSTGAPVSPQPSELPVAFRCLAESTLPASAGESSTKLTQAQRGWLVEALARSDRDALLRFLRERALLEGVAAQRATVELLERVGTGSDVSLLLRSAEAGLDGGDADVRPLFRKALTAILCRDSSTYPRLWSYIQRTDAALLGALVEAVREAGSPEGMLALSRLLDVEPALQEPVLASIGSLAERGRPPFDPRVVETVRARIDASSESVAALAVHAAAALDDHEAIPRLVEKLRDDSFELRGAALRGLRRMSGLNFSSDPRRWETWHRGEMQWWRDRAPEVLEMLRTGDAAEVNAVLGEIVTRRLFRHELARELVPVLESPEARLRMLACLGLGQIRSRAAVPALVESLEDHEESVRSAALSALRQITDRHDLETARDWATVLDD